MPASTHELLRDAVADSLRVALGAAGLLDAIVGGVVSMPEPNLKTVDRPVVLVTYEGTEYEQGAGTNLRKDVAYPLLVGLYTVKAVEDPPGMELTLFREVVSGLFSGRRLAGFPTVLWCDYSGQAQLIVDSFEAFKDLRTACTVTPVMRRLRIAN